MRSSKLLQSSAILAALTLPLMLGACATTQSVDDAKAAAAKAQATADQALATAQAASAKADAASAKADEMYQKSLRK